MTSAGNAPLVDGIYVDPNCFVTQWVIHKGSEQPYLGVTRTDIESKGTFETP